MAHVKGIETVFY